MLTTRVIRGFFVDLNLFTLLSLWYLSCVKLKRQRQNKQQKTTLLSFTNTELQSWNIEPFGFP